MGAEEEEVKFAADAGFVCTASTMSAVRYFQPLS